MYSHYHSPPQVAQSSPQPKSSTKQIHRNRASYSCHSCRRRKVKCDRQHPMCGGCIKMNVLCEWSDNSGAGGNGVEDQTSRQRSKSLAGLDPSLQWSPTGGSQHNGSPMASPTAPPRGHKRQRTNPNANVGISDDSDSPDDRYTMVSGIAALGGVMMPEYHSNTLTGTILPHPSHALPPSRLGNLNLIGLPLTKEQELESRMNRLAGIVDKWYRDAYLNNSQDAGVNGSINKESLRRDLDELQKLRGAEVDRNPPSSNDWGVTADAYRRQAEFPGGLRAPPPSGDGDSHMYANGLPQQDPHLYETQELPFPANLDASSGDWRMRRDKGLKELESMIPEATPDGNPNIDPQITAATVPVDPNLDGPNAASTRKIQHGLTQMANAVTATGVDKSVEELALGHLSIQEDGRTRYVGSTFWAFISNEITELNQVLDSQPKLPDHSACPSKDALTRSILESPLSKNTEDAGMADKDQSAGWPSTACDDSGRAQASNPADIIQTITHPDGSRTCVPMASASNMTDGSAIPMSLLSENSQLFPSHRFGHSPKNACREIPKLLKYLPTEAQCKTLYAAFLNGVHPVMPLLHIPTFDADFKTFWTWYPHKFKQGDFSQGGPRRMGPTFFPLLFSVLYAGSLSISPQKFDEIFPSESHTRSVISTHLYTCATTSLTITAFPRAPTISSLIAFLIVNTCLIREEEPATSCAFVGVAMRIAQSMGLHRDGSLFRGLNEIEREVRRRVWWHIVYLDVQAAVATGLPPLVGSEDTAYDTRMVSECKDEFIGGDGPPVTKEDILSDEEISKRDCDGTHESLKPTRSSVAMIAAVGRYETTLVLRKLVVRLFGIKPPTKGDITEMGSMIFDLKTKLEERIVRIPARGVPELGLVPPSDSNGEDATEAEKMNNFNGWARTLLSLYSDKAFGVLYQPFLKSTKSKLWQHARQCALRSCHSFLRKFIHLSTSPPFQPYYWFVPGTIQPLHSAMILLLDLYERPDSAEAATGRLFLDQVFALFGSESASQSGMVQRPLLEGGREAWEMMGRLRRKAYARAGLDIHGAPLRGAEKPSGTCAASKATHAHDSTATPDGRSQPRPVMSKGTDPAHVTNPLGFPSPAESMLDAVPSTTASAAITDWSSTVPWTNGLANHNPATHIVDYSALPDGMVPFTTPDSTSFTSPPQSNGVDSHMGEFAAALNGNGGSSYQQSDANSSLAEETYFPLPSIGGISADAFGEPLILAPGMNMNIETGQGHIQAEDHGYGVAPAPSGNNKGMLMDMSTADFDWAEWDAVFGTFVTSMQTEDDYKTGFMNFEKHPVSTES